MGSTIENSAYRTPVELSVTPTKLNRVLMIGSCLAVGWPKVIETATPGCPCDFLVVNNRPSLPDKLPEISATYNFQLIQIPLRMIVPDHSYFRLASSDVNAYEQLFVESRARLSECLRSLMQWNIQTGMLTFVFNFLAPQQNPMGRLFSRYDLRNFVHFVEKLNQTLAEELMSYRNAHLFDFDQIVSTFGRRFFQDDAVCHMAHAAALSAADWQLDQDRLEVITPLGQSYPYRPVEYMKAAWSEIIAMYRSIQQMDLVKLIIVDIDDTLWRGVAAETTEVGVRQTEGWPTGLVEALGYLKRRGVLLAVVSKNDEQLVTKLWRQILRAKLSLDDFVARKINWRSKAENVEELLVELNLLPRNVVFIDDNPVEREAIKAAFPDIRTLGPNPYLWRRILLWSAETQTAGITSEAATRTEMVRAQVAREAQRKKVSREEFLAGLDLRVTLSVIASTESHGFARAIELINKTNQFNTTGKRWTVEECSAAFARGVCFCLFSASDRFTDYGIIGVVVVHGQTFEQFVMSCRVVGLDIELAVMAELLTIEASKGDREIRGLFRNTELNLLCRDLYRRCGFEHSDEHLWSRSTAPPLEPPPHIQVEWTNAERSRAQSAAAS